MEKMEESLQKQVELSLGLICGQIVRYQSLHCRENSENSEKKPRAVTYSAVGGVSQVRFRGYERCVRKHTTVQLQREHVEDLKCL